MVMSSNFKIKQLEDIIKDNDIPNDVLYDMINKLKQQQEEYIKKEQFYKLKIDFYNLYNDIIKVYKITNDENVRNILRKYVNKKE